MIQNKCFSILVVINLISIAAGANDLVIGLQKAPVRKAANFLSGVLGYLEYGDYVEILTTKEPWHSVGFQGQKGWIHQSALANSKAVLKDIGQGKEVSNETYKDELVAAGKGFSPEYEKLYQKENPLLDFAALDELEKRIIKVDEMKKFAKDGELKSSLLEGEQ